MNHAWAPIDATHSIPYAGGMSKNGHTVFIDKNVPRFVHVQGKPIDAHEGIAVHERVEGVLMHKMGMKYQDAHKLATGAENGFIKRKYGVDPQAYQGALRDGIAKARASGETPPASLDPKPYQDMGQSYLLTPQAAS